MKDIHTMNIDDYVNNSAGNMNGSTSAAVSNTTAAVTSSCPTSISSGTSTTGIIGAQKAIEKHLKLLANKNDANSCVELIQEILNNSHIYVFGEFISNEKLIRFAEENNDVKKWFQLLQLFAFGKYSDYSEVTHPPLTEMMRNKFRHLTIVSLSYKCKTIPYKTLLKELCISNLRELEDLIIDVIYLNIINGKMDQANGCLEVDSTISRDIDYNQLDGITNVLSNWCTNCDNILANIDKQIKQANLYKNDFIKNKNDLEQQISSLRKTIKMNVNEQTDEIDTCQNLTTSTLKSASGGSSQRLQSGLNIKMEKMKRSLGLANTNQSANTTNVNNVTSGGGSSGGGLRGSNVGSTNKLWSNK